MNFNYEKDITEEANRYIKELEKENAEMKDDNYNFHLANKQCLESFNQLNNKIKELKEQLKDAITEIDDKIKTIKELIKENSELKKDYEKLKENAMAICFDFDEEDEK